LEFNPSYLTKSDIDEISQFLSDLRQNLLAKQRHASKVKDSVYIQLTQTLNSVERVYALKRDYHNNALEEIVLGKNSIEKIVIYPDNIIRKYDLGYALPTSKFGRAHLYAPRKKVGKAYIDTVWFNALVLFVFSILLYLALLANLLRLINQYLERFKFKRLSKRIARYLPK